MSRRVNTRCHSHLLQNRPTESTGGAVTRETVDVERSDHTPSTGQRHLTVNGTHPQRVVSDFCVLTCYFAVATGYCGRRNYVAGVVE